MLWKKMLREMRGDFGQFFSLFILSFLAVSLFACFKSSNIGAYKALDVFESKSNLADGWLYGEGFTEDNLEAVRNLPDVKDAQLRMSVIGSSVKQDNAQVDLYLEEENIVTRPYVIEGGEFNPEDTESLWIAKTFADAWELQIGDEFAFEYNGVTVKKKIAGLVASPEYEYTCADVDLDTDYKNIAFVYMAYKAFPVREYVEHLIKNGDITVDDLLENTDTLDKVLEQLKAAGMTKDDITTDMLLEQADTVSDDTLFDMMPYTQLIFTTDRENVLSLEEEISDAIDENYAVFVDRDSVFGIKALADELEQHDQFSYAFTVVFLLIALLVIMTTMSRMVDRQRTQIGTMNALGMNRGKITRHYMSYSFVISLAGAVAGLFVGTFWCGQLYVDIFAMYYTVPDWKADYNGSFIMVVVVVVLVCTGASYFSCKKLLKVNPSESLRPAPPKAGKRCVFEKLPFWNSLGFTSQYNLRDISRAKLRAFMGVFGTACGMMLMICGIGANTTLNNIYEWTFEKLQNYDYDMQFSDDMTLDEADKLAEKYDGELVMMDSIEIAVKNHALSDDKKTTTLVVTEGKGYYGLTDESQEIISLKAGTIAISSKLAKNLGVDVGDKVYWHIYNKNDWYSSEVGIISRNPTVNGITMLREDYEKTGSRFKPSVLYTNEDVMGYEDKNDAVTVTHSNVEMLEAYQSTMQIMYVMVAAFMVFAAVMPIVVLYNSGNLSFHERIKEFATLKVLGFESRQIRHLLTVQNLWLSVLGIVIGAPFAKPLLQYMFDSNGDSWDYAAVIAAGDYIIAGILVFVVSALVSLFFSNRIKKLDMVEVLKGME